MSSNAQKEFPPEVLLQYETLVSHILTGLIGDLEKEIIIKPKFGKLFIEIDIPEAIRGYVIGRGGHVIRSINSLVEAAAFEKRYPTSITILD